MIKKIIAGISAVVMSLTLCSCGVIGGAPQPPKEVSKDATITETVLYDANNLVIKAKQLEFNNWSFSVYLDITNNGNKKLEVLSGSAGYNSNSINGYMVMSGYMNEELSANSTVSTDIDFDYNELQLLGIDKIANIKLAFMITDDDYNYIYTDPIEIKTNLDSGYNYSSEPFKTAFNAGVIEYVKECVATKKSQDVLMDNGGVKIDAFGFYEKEDEENQYMIYEINNTSSTQVLIRIDDVKVNGNMIREGLWSGSIINPNSRLVDTLNIDRLKDRDEWTEAGITEIQTISFKTKLLDRDGKQLGNESEVTFNIE